MIIFSPLYAVALAAVVFAPGVDATACPMLCTDATCTSTTIANDASLSLTKPEACPAYAFSYLTSLVVGTQLAEDKVDVKLGDTVVPSETDGTSGTCFKTYGVIGTTTPTADTAPTVFCPDATAACTVKVNPTWACSAPVCPTTCTGCKTGTLDPAATTTIQVTRADDTCGAGKFAYLKSLDVRGKNSKDVVVTFNNGLTPAPAKVATCSLYTDVIGLTSTATDVVASITCKIVAEACDFEYKADWGCYTPPVVAETYTRSGTPEGEGCKADVSDCSNRCAKSYQLGTKDLDRMFVPQFTADCTCPPLTATPGSSVTAGPVAANAATTMNVKFVTVDNTMTIAYTAAGKVCKTTYKKEAFVNKFAAKTYTRSSVMAADCVVAEAAGAGPFCAYKCAAEFALTKPLTDTINAAQTAVTGCTCATITAIVDADGAKASGGTALLKYDFGMTGADVTLKTTTTTAASPPVVTTCDAVYKETCPMLCTDATCTSTTIAKDASLSLTKPEACPAYTFSYLTSLAVGTQLAADQVDVKLGANAVPSVAAGTSGTCFKTYGVIGTTTPTADTAPTVTCPGATAACTVKVNPTWACSAPVCPATCTGCTPGTLAASATAPIEVKAPTNTCSGNLAYLKSLDVRGKNSKDVVVTFNNGLTPATASKGPSCSFYTNVMKLASSATDIVASIRCKNEAEGCDIEYKAEWGCLTYTRSGTPEGEGCKADVSDCSNRCAKSYQLGKSNLDMTFVPQFTTGCTCPPLMATPKSGDDTAAANAATTMDVKFVTADNTMTIAYTAAEKVCKTTYKREAFVNKFTAKSYTRSSVTPACVAANDAGAGPVCAYKCAAEFALTTPADTVNATQAVVADCDCMSITAIVDADGAKASNVTVPLKYDFGMTGADVTLKTTTTTAASPPVVTTCDAVYKETCPMLCTDATCTSTTIAKDASLSLTKPEACPAYTFSYLMSLAVGTQLAADQVDVKLGANAVPSVAAGTSGTCFKTYGVIGTTTPTADTAPTVICPGATATCTVKVNPTWACSAPVCPATCTSCTPGTLAASAPAPIEVKAPDNTCATGKFAYLKSLDVRGKNSKDVVVTFNNGLTPATASKGPSCSFYTNVMKLASSATDIVASIACKNVAEGCDFEYKAEWGCYTPPVVAETYTRSGTPEGEGCKADVSDCSNRCAKSYQLGTKDSDRMFVPQFTTGCTCPPLTATPGSSVTAGPVAANAATTMDVKFVTADNTMTIAYTAAGKVCKTTYKKEAFVNKFVAKTYTRSSVTPACVVADGAGAGPVCAYKCAAEFALTTPADTVNATQAAVTDCDCTSIIAIVEADGAMASVGTAPLKYEFVATNATSVALKTTTTTAASPPVVKICDAVYMEKVTPEVTEKPTEKPVTPETTTTTPATTTMTPATTTKTGSSAGVSALGAGADAGMVTVTLVAAAAGVQVVGMPV